MNYIFFSDFHLRSDRPLCRPARENFLKTQRLKLEWILEQAKKYRAVLCFAGDLFHTSSPSYACVNMLLETILEAKKTIDIAIPGNHDLPYHNPKLIEDSAYGLCRNSRIIAQEGVDGFEYSFQDPVTECWVKIIHRYVYKVTPPVWADDSTKSAAAIMNENRKMTVIVSGDNHKGFLVQQGKRFLINPGCVTRSTALEAKYKPRVYLWNAEKNTVKPLWIPLRFELNPDQLIDEINAKSKMTAFIASLGSKEIDTSISFLDNLQKIIFTQKNNLDPGVRSLIKCLIGELRNEQSKKRH